MDWKEHDWIEHPTLGIGQIHEDRGDRFDIEFVVGGRKIILKSTQLNPGNPPSLGFKFPKATSKSQTPKFKVGSPSRRSPLDFDHLVEGFKRVFTNGFDSPEFERRERREKEKAADRIKGELGKQSFESLLRDGHYAEVCDTANRILRSINLAHPFEKTKFADCLKIEANQRHFANALYNLLHGEGEMEARFTSFWSLLSEMSVNKWPIATYFQFLASDGKWMFMKPEVMQQMAESLKIALNYKPEPNWLTYSKLQELADRVDLELQNRGLKAHSRIDIQGFIWAAISIEEGNYDKI